jgi:hypothetical protein
MQTVAANWQAPADVCAFTSTRIGGVSRGAYESFNLAAHVGDDADAVTQNRAQLRQTARLPAEPLWLNQVHGNEIVLAGSGAFSTGTPDADGVISRDGGAVLGILTADCLPIVICSRTGPALAALHCGWRSLAAGIVERAVARLATPPDDLLAWLGPAITQPAFEVGDEVRDLFLAGVEDATDCFMANDNDRWQADLPGLARLYLAAAGVLDVADSALCTFGDRERFFSYRRDGQCGRMATVVFRRAAGSL